MAFLKSLVSRPAVPFDEPLHFDDTAFSRPGKDGFTAEWSQVKTIVGYKIDLLTVDEIRINFGLVTGTTVIVTEESPNFAAFMAEVERRFPSVSGWHGKIAQPAFATSETTLYEPHN